MSRTLFMAALVASAAVTVPVGAQHAAFDASGTIWDQERWTDRCLESVTPLGDGNDFFSTCNSAELTLFQNGWVELKFWNRNGIEDTEENSRVKAVALSGISTPTGTRGTGAGNGWDILFDGFQLSNWSPRSDITGFANGNGYETSNQTICSDLSTSCPGHSIETLWNTTTMFAGGGFIQFVWFVGTNFTYIYDNIALETHAISGPNGWSTAYVCTPDGGTETVVLYSKTWDCGEGDVPGDGTSVVPEPATMTLLATGLVGLAASRRRKKNAV